MTTPANPDTPNLESMTAEQRCEFAQRQANLIVIKINDAYAGGEFAPPFDEILQAAHWCLVAAGAAAECGWDNAIHIRQAAKHYRATSDALDMAAAYYEQRTIDRRRAAYYDGKGPAPSAYADDGPPQR